MLLTQNYQKISPCLRIVITTRTSLDPSHDSLGLVLVLESTALVPSLFKAKLMQCIHISLV